MECLKKVKCGKACLDINLFGVLFVLTTLLIANDIFAQGKKPAEPQKNEIVIILHGILNRPMIMQDIQRALEREGYEVKNWGYKSRKKLVQEYAADLDAFVKALPLDTKKHFVGFSLGSIITRYYLSHYPLQNCGRFVMIAPPNHGSEVAEALYDFKWFQWIYGTKAIQQLKSDNSDFFEKCGVPPCEFGIIVGGKGDGEGYSSILPGDDDGSVSFESTQLTGAQDVVQVKSRHTILLFRKKTIEHILSFLSQGRFKKKLNR